MLRAKEKKKKGWSGEGEEQPNNYFYDYEP